MSDKDTKKAPGQDVDWRDSRELEAIFERAIMEVPGQFPNALMRFLRKEIQPTFIKLDTIRTTVEELRDGAEANRVDCCRREDNKQAAVYVVKRNAYQHILDLLNVKEKPNDETTRHHDGQ